ncbi:BON domain-containing protein [Andreprevotia chitinilytica]|uniref:BON domain-containing protein n=1 Tax=Andreprevotia chitinilytica TaxID=396808 RepID=UPI00068D420C|nr:BON domain-containing protein [Andreprevotia chitinilytica]
MNWTSGKRTLAIALAATGIALSACVPILVAGGVAVGAWIGSDPRKSETQATDLRISTNITNRIYDLYKTNSHVNVHAFNGQVLLTGEAPTEADRAKIQQIARTEAGVKKLYDETVVAPPSELGTRANDTQLTARVKTAILNSAGDPNAIHILVTTERKVVYLMGITTEEIANRAAQAAANVGGVTQVVKLIEYAPAGPAGKGSN